MSTAHMLQLADCDMSRSSQACEHPARQPASHSVHLCEGMGSRPDLNTRLLLSPHDTANTAKCFGSNFRGSQCGTLLAGSMAEAVL